MDLLKTGLEVEKSEDFKCIRCDEPDPEHFHINEDGDVYGCSSCPDLHVWEFDTCIYCGILVMEADEKGIVCPNRMN